MILCGTLTLETVKTVKKFVSLTKMLRLYGTSIDNRGSEEEFFSGKSEYSEENSRDEGLNTAKRIPKINGWADNSDKEMDDGG